VPPGRERFVEAVARDRASRAGRRGKPSSWSPRRVGLLAAAVLVVVLGAVLWIRPGHTVDVEVVGAPVASGGYVQTSTSPATLRFDDGTVMTLSPSSSGRVTERRARGARFSLEGGRVVAKVAKRPGGADYEIDAGPWVVRVTGTELDLAWDPDAGHMRLLLVEGAVVVTGPDAQEGVTVHAGQVLEIARGAGLRLASADAAPSTPSTPSTGSVTASAEAATEGAPSSPASEAASASPQASAAATKPSHTSWSERVAAGDFEGVLADAEARGIDATLASAPAGDLMALADAARYAGKSGVAAQALKAIRGRFAGTKAASTAAFLLGRMAEDGGNVDGALGLYETAMAEGSTFSGEALGRRMLLVKRTRGDAQARPLAERYLASYPKGGYAEAARALVDR
jgi:hypothetical protein